MRGNDCVRAAGAAREGDGVSIIGKIGRAFGGAVAESLTDQLREAHRENERLRGIMRKMADQSFACERCRDRWVRAVDALTEGRL